MIRYPDGRSMKEVNKTIDKKVKDLTRKNMGMFFESEITKSCYYYRMMKVADIYKRPTPIKVVKMKGTMINEAYFQEKSTTDYVGIYKGFYIDFECKETIHKRVPYTMIREQQYAHLKMITELGGIGFFLVHFKTDDSCFLIDAMKIIDEKNKGERKSFSYEFFTENATIVKRGYNPPFYFIEALEEEFKNKFSLS